jgi:large subunit ribosomal protein L16
MLFPKRVKYRKWQTARKNPKKRGIASRGVDVSFGSHGLKTLDGARITSNQIEAARRVMRRALGKNGKIWIRIFPDRPFTRKAAEVGMGKGKGNPEGFLAPVKPGQVLFEVDGVSEELAQEALQKAGKKMPIKWRVVTRR